MAFWKINKIEIIHDRIDAVFIIYLSIIKDSCNFELCFFPVDYCISLTNEDYIDMDEKDKIVSVLKQSGLPLPTSENLDKTNLDEIVVEQEYYVPPNITDYKNYYACAHRVFRTAYDKVRSAENCGHQAIKMLTQFYDEI